MKSQRVLIRNQWRWWFCGQAVIGLWSLMLGELKIWAFYKVTTSYFPVSVNDRRDEQVMWHVNLCLKCTCCILYLYRKFGVFRMDISAEWKVMTIQSIAPDTGIEYKSEVLFKLCTPLLQLRTKKNSEMFSQDQYLLNCNLFNIHLLLYIKYAGISVG